MNDRRTEEPTPRRLREARRRGEVSISRDLTSAAALASGLVALWVTGPAIFHEIVGWLRVAISNALSGDADPPGIALARSLALFTWLVLPVSLASAGGALIAGIVQTKGLFSMKAIAFRLDRVRPGPGLRRLFSADRAITLALGVAKAIALLAAAGWLLTSSARILGATTRGSPPSLLAPVSSVASRTALVQAVLLAAFGLFELARARRRERERLMMTREEVARERRDDEGDPRLEFERRRLHRALIGAAPLRQATCLVVNPTHLAVALRHVKESDDAPVVLAKGSGAAAARLRAEAVRAGIPTIRDVALARALYRLADVGEEIPEELYDAAAALLIHVHGLHGSPS